MNSNNYTILIVSPDRVMLRRLTKFLEVFGYEVLQATGAREAVAGADRHDAQRDAGSRQHRRHLVDGAVPAPRHHDIGTLLERLSGAFASQRRLVTSLTISTASRPSSRSASGTRYMPLQ